MCQGLGRARCLARPSAACRLEAGRAVRQPLDTRPGTGTTTRLTFDPAFDDAPMWSPDGTRIVFSSNRSGPADLYPEEFAGAGQDEILLKSDHGKIPTTGRPTGVSSFIGIRSPRPVGLVGPCHDGSSKPQRVLTTPFDERQGALFTGRAMDGLCVQRHRHPSSGVQSFPPSGGKWQISTSGGVQPRWRRDGKELSHGRRRLWHHSRDGRRCGHVEHGRLQGRYPAETLHRRSSQLTNPR